ncbi:FGGY family of carbohydrate kinases, N-terminal domain containing protein [Trichomonas vaginalis G3]|uniref:FGGY family of carbohydrate kinases, N-terminal domain containing protein n=1 Tax=Trichomonas vaginalis (strain ATCC PRA-98 / G3) TaxID=412133 RepID=A2G0B1_TRIV3|nr:glycerol kinase protein [Trichomonas vaginalis G3]EAX89408.1 FGGY family of carbohydrate kinases, N-terminal domain containing protein [Trichomonas vaginalis G3]KAI5494146.1 glycerol kinase protein [Trichomonas vaginalis G3]|eukprot:XP_001302338.1 FGGY family of carbohydrate kinases, N-terminal domain containing protein [Trichomonas vaginalis G3]
MFSLGIDIGTSKIAIAVVDVNSKITTYVDSKAHDANIHIKPGFSEQSVDKIFETTDNLISNIPIEIKQKIGYIGITGQMHGVVVSRKNNKTDNLINWEDRRGSVTGKLKLINAIKGCEKLKDGFGMTTLAQLDLSDAEHCATIHDLYASYLTGLRSVTDPTDAASWGLFDIFTNKWNEEAIKSLNIPQNILPEVVKCGSFVGKIKPDIAEKFDLNKDVEVYAALGDNQASISGTSLERDQDIYITIGTGMQLSLIANNEIAKELINSNKIEVRPFLKGQFLAVSAPLLGGEAWKSLALFVDGLIENVTGTKMNIDDVYKKIDELGLAEFDSDDLPDFEPYFIGERWDTSLRGVLSNLTLSNFKIGKISAALAKGIAKTLRGDITQEMLASKSRIVASGNALRKSKLLTLAITKEFEKEVIFSEAKEEAARGAAIFFL